MSNKVRVVQKIKKLEEKVKRPAVLKIGANALQEVLMSPAKKAIRALKYKLSDWFGNDFLAHRIEGEYLVKADIDLHDFDGMGDDGLRVTFPLSYKNVMQGLNKGDYIEIMSKESALFGQLFICVEEDNTGDVAEGQARLVSDTVIRFTNDAGWSTENEVVLKVKYSAGNRK